MTTEKLAKAIWSADDEWNDLVKRDKLDPAADWAEWIANAALKAIAEEIRGELNPISVPGTNFQSSAKVKWILF